jgi:hypothetical protein
MNKSCSKAHSHEAYKIEKGMGWKKTLQEFSPAIKIGTAYERWHPLLIESMQNN